jgi:hypothetical protein
MKLRNLAALTLVSCLTSALGCSAGADDDSSRTRPGTGGANGTGGTSGGPGPVGTSGTFTLGGMSPGTGAKDPNDPRDVPTRTKTCDATGTVCTCLRLALLGTLETAAAQKDTKPFIDWLNGKSGGTAVVTMESEKPNITDEFLAKYDILLVANVNTWTFSAEEKAAVQKWVKEMGGGIITLTGFASTVAEVTATSQLVDFAGMGYTGSNPSPAPGGDWAAPGDLILPKTPMPPVTYRDGGTDLRNCMNLWSVEIDRQAALTIPIKFTPQTGSLDKLTASLFQVGAYIGWPVKAPAGSTVVATDPISGKPMAVAYEVDQKGRIFSFGDEWVILANQWQPSGASTDPQMTESNPCWLPPTGTEAGMYHSARTLYQTKQFWYDVINWVAPPNECNFTIVDPDVVVK